MNVMRWGYVYKSWQQLLDKNLSQREIQQNLNTSAATITRGSNMLKTMDPDFINWVKSQLDEQAAKN